jgi:adenosylcobinamide kinase/adenosylcobinamide-phosphate guanylyltransferase
MIALVVGGARSGKSRYAARVAKELSARPVMLATARAFDEDHAARIARHIAERGPEWTTVEEQKAIARPELAGRVVVVDCATLWLTNLFLDGDAKNDPEGVMRTARAELEKIEAIPATWIFVSNEVGMSLHAETAVGRRFVDLQGFLNQEIAARSAAVALMVAGIPVPAKGGDMTQTLRAGPGA